ncbi:MAG: hypothetical protein E6Q95_03050 [Chitinophagaceae bacterium]|nr:MAG: hypothetical protein E6Q95_03050 [Chitinophagaceae bacterium]
MKKRILFVAVLLSTLSFLSFDASAQYHRKKAYAHAEKVIIVKNHHHHHEYKKHQYKKNHFKNKYYKKHSYAHVNPRHHKTVKVVYLTPRMMKQGRRA